MKFSGTKLLLGTALTATAFAACKSHFKTTTDTGLTAKKYEASMERGKTMLMSSCAGCHIDFKTGRLSGRKMENLPGILGSVYSANLTVSKEHGVAMRYTDAELAYLIRTGIARDGRFIPYMLRPNMGDQDVNDLIVYMRSGDGPLAAVDTTFGQTHYSLIGKMARPFMGKPQPYKTDILVPEGDASPGRGRYLVDNVGCFHCHSKKITALNYLHPEKSKGYMAGGAKFKTPSGDAIRGSNITMDSATGIGFYTRAEFREAVRHARGPGNRKLQPPMEAFSELTNVDADAIYAYIKTLPAKRHRVKGQLAPIER